MADRNPLENPRAAGRDIPAESHSKVGDLHEWLVAAPEVIRAEAERWEQVKQDLERPQRQRRSSFVFWRQ